MQKMLALTCLLSASLAFSTACHAKKNEQAEKTEEIHGQQLAAPIVLTPELIAAHHDYQLAQLRWQQYRFHEVPQQRRLLDQQVRLAEAEVQVLKRRIRDYRPFLQVGRYSPVRTAAENDRLALLATEQQLKLLRNERINSMRTNRQHNQLYQLEVLRTAAKVLAMQQSQETNVEMK